MNLPADISKSITELAQSIPDEDLAGSGRESNPHITVKYGLHENDPAQVRKLVDKQSMPQARLLETACFEGVENGTMDAVILNVDSADLCNLNKVISTLPHTDTWPTYKPHVTVAYVKLGLGAKYAGNKALQNTLITFKELTYSDKDGVETTIPFLPRNSDHTVAISDSEIYTRYLDTEEQISSFLQFQSYEPYSKIASRIEGELGSLNNEEIDELLQKASGGDVEAQESVLREYIDKFPDIAFNYKNVELKKNEETGEMEPSLIAVGINADTGRSSIPVGGISRYKYRVQFTGENKGENLYGDGDIVIPEKIVKIEKKNEEGDWIEYKPKSKETESQSSGEVHVSAHTREGGKVDVQEHTRSYPERDMSPLGVSFTDYYVDYWFEDEEYKILDTERFKLGVWTSVTRWRGQDVQNMEVQAYTGPDGKRRYRTRVKKAQTKKVKPEERTGEQVDMSLDRLKELRKKHVDDIQPITLAEDALEVVRTDFHGMGSAAPIGHVPENLDKLLKNSIALQAKLADLDSQLRMAERRQKIRGNKGLLIEPTANEDLKELIELYEDAADHVGAMTRRFFDRLDEWKDQSGMGALNTELDNWKLPDGDVNAKDVANATHNAMFELNKLPAYLRHSLKVFKNGVNISKGGIYSSAANTSITSKEEIQEQHRWAGVYFPGQEGKVIVEFKQYGMGNTIVHEVAHAIDFEVLGITSLPAHEWKPTRLGRSFVKFWKDQKLQFEEYGQTDVSEGFATGLTTYLDVPEWMKQHQPVIYKWFKDNIGESRKERQWQEFVKESTKEYEKKELAKKKLQENQAKGEM